MGDFAKESSSKSSCGSLYSSCHRAAATGTSMYVRLSVLTLFFWLTRRSESPSSFFASIFATFPTGLKILDSKDMASILICVTILMRYFSYFPSLAGLNLVRFIFRTVDTFQFFKTHLLYIWKPRSNTPQRGHCCPTELG